MPEGDTIHKLAAALRPPLEGRTLGGLWLRDRGWLRPLAEQPVREVAALGKHLLIVIGAAPRDAWVLHVHLGMHGRWHRFGRDRAWPRPQHQAVVRLEVAQETHVCSRAARAELLRRLEVATHPSLSRLGPDLLAPPVDFAAIVRRARRREPRSAAELLLDQRVACGIGNVYKSEVLFLEGVHPGTPVATLSDAAVERLYRRASQLMRWNLRSVRRTTLRPVATGERLPRAARERSWVYDRAREPCRRCAALVRTARLGDDARPTWWCPSCQAARASRREARLAPAPSR